MFLLRASRYLEELATVPSRHSSMPAVPRSTGAHATAISCDWTSAAFAACPSDSIDYAVMEKTDAAMVLPVDVGWNDVGSWSALWEVANRTATAMPTMAT